jgi:hypothetical protein
MHAAPRAGARAGHDVGLELPLHVRALPLHFALRGPGLLHQAPPLRFGLAHDHLCLALGRRARRLPQLLRCDERFVHGALPLAVRAQLLAQRGHALFEDRLFAQDALQFVGHTPAEVLDAHRLVATQAAAEFLLAHVERREVEDVRAHVASASCRVSLAPNSTVPKRITVAPSSTAIP